MLFDVVQPSNGNKYNYYLLRTYANPGNNQISVQITKQNPADAEDFDIKSFLNSFPVEETNTENLLFSIKRAGKIVEQSTRRGFGDQLFVHPKTMKNLPPNINIFRYIIHACEHIAEDEFFLTYMGNAMDRGWIVLENGKMIKNDGWESYGARVRLIEDVKSAEYV